MDAIKSSIRATIKNICIFIKENSSWTPWSNWTVCDDNGTMYRSKTCIGTARYGGEVGCEPEGKLEEDMRVCNISQGAKIKKIVIDR